MLPRPPSALNAAVPKSGLNSYFELALSISWYNGLRRLHLTIDDDERLSTHEVGALFSVYHWVFVAIHVLHDPQRVG